MRVTTLEREYTLYLEANGTWTMHVWDINAPVGDRFIATCRRVSGLDPFESEVEYDAWR